MARKSKPKARTNNTKSDAPLALTPVPRPPRGSLNRDKVLVAAMALADSDGLAALSMRKLAASLGVEAMSLYNHIQNKDDIVDGMVDRVAGEIDLPTLDFDWKGEMRRRSQSVHSVLMAHPWAAMPFLSQMNSGPNMLRYIDATLGCFLAVGFSPAQADYAWNAIDNHIYGFTFQALNVPLQASKHADIARANLVDMPKDQLPNLYRLTAEMAEGHHDGVQDFDFGLNLILDGLERLL